MTEWVETVLGDVLALDLDVVGVEPTKSYAMVGVLNRGRGLLLRDSMQGSETSYKTLNKIGRGQVVYSRLKAFEGAITVAGSDLHEAYASQEFPTFTCGSSLLPGYFRLLTTTQYLWDTLQNLSTGMGGRRERVKPSDFLTIRVALPPLREQRRIVDAMAAVDAQVDSLTDEVERARRFLAARRAALVDDPAVGFIPGREAFDILMGRQRSPQRANGPSMTPYLRSANVGAGALNLDDVKQMDFDARERIKFGLQRGDVVVSEGSASANAVGMASVWNDEIPGPVCFQNTLLRYRAIEGVSHPTFVAHWCKWAYESGKFRDAASGTNIKHIGSTRALAMPVALPSIATQRTIGTELDSIEHQWTSVSVELTHLRVLRGTLLTALLNQEIEIPESYDSLLKESAT